MRPLYRPKDNQERGAALVLDLLIYLMMTVMIGFTVASGVKMLVTQQSAGANQLQQKSAVLQAMNRTSADIISAKPIVYAAPTELITENVLNVAGQTPKTVQQRYVLVGNTLYSQQRDVPGGVKYDPSKAASYWGTPNASQAEVLNINTTPAPGKAFAIYTYFDRAGIQLNSIYANFTGYTSTDVIARVDSILTANLDKAGNVQLASSAVPRASLPIDTAATNLAPPTCPAFSVNRSDDGSNAVIRWAPIAIATSYEVWRDGTKISTIASVSGKTDYYFQEPLLQDGRPHQYKVLAVTPSGISQNCESKNVTSEIPATLLTGQMIPATTGNNPWTSTAWADVTQTTIMKLTWTPVSGASSYILYRSPVADNGTIGAKVETQRYDTNEPLVFNYPAEWDKKWSWTVSVMATSGGSKDSNAVALRGYPSPAVTKAAPTTYSVNTIDWLSYVPDANVDSYSLYRSKDGQPNGSYDLLATYTRGTADFTSEKYIDDGTKHAFGKPALGSTHTYVVIVHNESGYSNKVPDSQLQFPPDPVMTSVGAGGSRDNDSGSARSNTIMWSAAKSATGYQVQRSLNGVNDCLSGSNCALNSGGQTATSKVDSDSAFVKPSTMYAYVAYAYNSTGISPRLAAKVDLIQRPAAPSIGQPAGSDVPSLNDNITTIKWSQNAGGWCQNIPVTPGELGCTYETTNFNNSRGVLASLSLNASTTTANFGNQDWGRHYYYKNRARNGAVTNNGYSDYSNEVSANTYPGAFGVNGAKGNVAGTAGSDQYWDFVFDTVDFGIRYFPGSNGNKNDAGPSWGYVAASWGSSPGARSIQSVQNYIGGGTNVTAGSSTGGAGTTDARALPGSQYRFTMTATSIENSLTRTVSTAVINTNPDITGGSEIAALCVGSGNTQYNKTQQTRFKFAPKRGSWSTGTTASIWRQGGSGDNTTGFSWGDVNYSYSAGNTYSAVNSTNNGVKSDNYTMGGFQNYVTWNGVGYSSVVENYNVAIVPLSWPAGSTMGCGTGSNYIEAGGTCYGYYSGTQSCAPTIAGNRPQYDAR